MSTHGTSEKLQPESGLVSVHCKPKGALGSEEERMQANAHCEISVRQQLTAMHMQDGVREQQGTCGKRMERAGEARTRK